MTIRLDRTALVAGHKNPEAATSAAEISTYLTETLGMPTTWGVEIGGPVGTLHWYIDFANMADLEAGLGKSMTDAGYIELIAKAADLFIEGRTEDSIIYIM
jgi:hypothetical protein